MYKPLLIAVSVALLFFFLWRIAEKEKDTLRGEISALKNDIKRLESSIENYNKSQKISTDTILKLRNEVKKNDKSCYNTRLSDGELNVVRKTGQNKK